MAQLPLYYSRNGRPSSGPSGTSRRWREFYLLLVLFVSFVTILAGLMWFVPSVEQHGNNFEDTYSRFVGDKGSASSKTLYASPFRADENKVEAVNVLPPPNESESSKDFEFEKGDAGTEKKDKANEREEVRGMHKEMSNKEEGMEERKQEVEVEMEAGREENGNMDVYQEVDNGNELRRQKVVEMVKLAWDGYVQFAWGDNELKPLSKQGHSASVFGRTHLGATIVDSLDTLYLTGLTDEFEKAKNWVELSLTNLDQVSGDVSVFEFNIRYVGGLLSAYALSGEEIFKQKAVEIADRLLPAFNTATGIPMAIINLKTGNMKNWGWASGGCSVLAEFGSLHLEFQYLTHITGNPIYLQKVKHIREKLQEMSKPGGLYPNFLHPRTGNWGTKHSSLGALGDSFYEYLLKSWLGTSKMDAEAKDMFFNAIDTMEDKGMFSKTSNGLTVVNDLKNGRPDGKMQHLSCFSGGMYALASAYAINGKSDHYMTLGKEITNTCYESYRQTASKLGPEAFHFDANGVMSSKSNEKVFLLRPETVESIFVLWRLTHDQMYRDWGWNVVEALEKVCRTPNGYSGVRDVYNSQPVKDDVQQSFFIAETLKYLFLLFSDDSILPLDSWVLNTEAHPLPVLPGIPNI